MFNQEKFRSYEQFFIEKDDNAPSFELLEGQGAVMISAPHSVEQTRNNQVKYAEPQTGALAKMLHDTLHCPVIYKRKNCGDDANFDENCAYKQALCQYVKDNKIALLLDLHQLSPTRKIKINIGTGKYKNVSNRQFIETAIQAFEKQNIGKVAVDKPFGATYPFTVSAYVASICKISCLQIEIHSNAICLDKEETQTENIFNALMEIIQNATKIIQGEE